jgi:hypothetical protein
MTSPAPTAKLLREFAWILAGAIAFLWGLALPLLHGKTLPPLPWILAGVLVIMGTFAPTSLAPLYRLWMQLGEKLGWLNSRLLLGIIFFAIITPMATAMRLLRRDTMNRSWERQQASYRISSTVRPFTHMEKPY